MSEDKETPEMRRERLRQEELKNPASSFHGGGLADLAGGLSWRGTGILILVFIIGFMVKILFFN